MYLLTNFMSSFEKCVLNFVVLLNQSRFFLRLLFLLFLLSIWCSFYVLGIIHLNDTWLKSFSSFYKLSLHSVFFKLCCVEFFSWLYFHLSILFAVLQVSCLNNDCESRILRHLLSDFY